MAQNITLMGASYSDVPAVELPKTGGGTALFSDPSITTALASDVASGKTFLLADGSIGTGTASGGGGGASNVVTGTFKGTTTGAALEVNIPYTGNGYPIAIAIYPKDGYQTGSPAYSLLQKNVVVSVSGVKKETTSPTYESTGSQNQFYVVSVYKSSASTASSTSATSSQSAQMLSGGNATAAATGAVKFKDKKTMSVYIASSSYGFAANIEYTYHVIYSA